MLKVQSGVILDPGVVEYLSKRFSWTLSDEPVIIEYFHGIGINSNVDRNYRTVRVKFNTGEVLVIVLKHRRGNNGNYLVTNYYDEED